MQLKEAVERSKIRLEKLSSKFRRICKNFNFAEFVGIGSYTLYIYVYIVSISYFYDSYFMLFADI